MRIDLTGNWYIRKENEDEWLRTKVPDCNYTALLENNLIEDPFFGRNEEKLLWPAEHTWEFRKIFEIEKELLSYDAVYLVFEMLDTVCDVYLNKHCLGKCENADRTFKFDVKKHLILGENELNLVFHSPLKYIAQKEKLIKSPYNPSFIKGLVHIRKPQSHFGWDWGPKLPACGIFRQVYLKGLKGAYLGTPLIRQEHFDKYVKLDFSCAVALLKTKTYDYIITIKEPSGQVISKKGSCRENIEESIKIHAPELWYTHDLSDKKEQPLYTVSFELLSENEIIDRVEKTIGLRTIKLNTDRDEYGQNFCFELNGKPIFAKGANWIPPDSFINRFNSKRLKGLIDAALFANFNMIRVWGGGYYESEEFYDICDKVGILVWQDFAFACNPYPFFDQEFLDNVLLEVADNVKRLRHRASLALWCGNNEIEQLSAAWFYSRKYIKWTKVFFYEILKNEVEKHDSVTDYVPGSPSGIAHLKGVNSDNVGDTHLWGVWHGLHSPNYYSKRLTRFCSEFGFESLPDLKTIKSYTDSENLSLYNKDVLSHQKCPSGNDKMLYYIGKKYRTPKDFKSLIYASQIVQNEYITQATEHWRRNKGRCNGALYWQFNDCWPVTSWSGIDYKGNFKALQYGARSFNSTISCSIEIGRKSLRAFISNDSLEKFEGGLRIRYFDIFSSCYEEGGFKISLDANGKRSLFDKSLTFMHKEGGTKLSDTGIRAKLVDEHGRVIFQMTLLYKPEKSIKLPDAKIEVDYPYNDDYGKVRVFSEKYARFVRLEASENGVIFSDNYFDLLPGEERVIKIETSFEGGGELVDIVATSYCDHIPQKRSLKDFMIRMFIFLKPVNFLPWLFYLKRPKDIKFNE